jgi:hypothetical protein
MDSVESRELTVNAGREMSGPLLTGNVIVEGGRGFSGAQMRIMVEDVSRQNAASISIAEQIIDGVSYDPSSGAPLPFELDGVVPDNRANYAVRVHVDVDGDGDVSRGDFITMESYPVLTHGHPERVTVRVREVQ